MEKLGSDHNGCVRLVCLSLLVVLLCMYCITHESARHERGDFHISGR